MGVPDDGWCTVKTTYSVSKTDKSTYRKKPRISKTRHGCGVCHWDQDLSSQET
jgi:hypothetical protein